MTASFSGPFFALISSVTWAFGSTGYSKIAKENSAFAVNFSRGMIAFPLFLLTALLTGVIATGQWSSAFSPFHELAPRNVGWFSLSIISSYAIGDSLFLISSRAIGVPAALTIASSYPLLTASWGALVQGEWLGRFQTLGLLITVGGVAAVILSAPRQLEDAESTASKRRIGKPLGIGFAAMSALCWAVNSYSVTLGGQGVSAPVGNTLRMGMAMILCPVIGKLLLPGEPVFMPLKVYKRWLWLFILEGFGGSYSFLYGLSHSPLAIGSTLASVAPVISVPIALAMGLERFCWKRTVGVVTVVFGLWLLVGGLNG